MLNGRFYLGWLLSAGLMYLAFYIFHGVITNDLLKLTVPKTAFLSVAAMVYLVIALGMSLLFKSQTLKKHITNPFKRSAPIGICTAIFMYSIAFVVGIRFSFQASMINIAVDLGWQLFEQSLGAFTICLAHTIFYREPETFTNFM